MYLLKQYRKWRRASAFAEAPADRRSLVRLRAKRYSEASTKPAVRSRGGGWLALRAEGSGIVLVLICLALVAPVGATVLVPVDLGELSRDASAIVRGRVAAVDAQWSDDRRSIQTIVTLEVEDSLKGPLNSTARFVLPGGTLGRYRRIVVGAPEFVIGQHIVVFLAWRGPSYPYLLGFSQGVFRVVTARDGSGSVVIPPPIIAPVTGAAPIVRGDTARRPLPLNAFEERVRALAGAQ